MPLIQVAIEKRLSSVVVMLLLWGRDVNALLDSGRTPLHLAIANSVRPLLHSYASY